MLLDNTLETPFHILPGIRSIEGDLDGDGDVNAADLTLLGQYWQWGVP
jgi:hypothetical protein